MQALNASVAGMHVPRVYCFPAYVSLGMRISLHIRYITYALYYALQIKMIYVSPGILFPHLRCAGLATT